MEEKILKVIASVILMCFVATIGSCCWGLEASRIEAENQYNSSFTRPIERVFMHEIGKYSVLIREDGSLVSMPLYGNYANGRGITVKLIDDVPTNGQMYVKKMAGTFEVHIHNINDINGADWDHGKFGKGTTTVVD